MVFAAEGISFGVTSEWEGACCAVIRPEAVTISPQPERTEDINCVSGTVADVIDRGPVYSIVLDTPARLNCLVSRASTEGSRTEPGQRVYACFRPSAVHLIREM